MNKAEYKKWLETNYPVRRSFHTGKFGYERINGCIDLRCCVFKSEIAAKQSRYKYFKHLLSR